MISLGLTTAGLRTLTSLLRSNHHINIKMSVLTRSHAYVADVSTRLVSGQVDMDVSAQVTRSCKFTLLDPLRTLHLDSDSPNDGALYLDRMIRITYNVHAPDGSFTCDIPLFCGPITKLDRTGAYLNVECQGKEVFSLLTAWNARTYKKGIRKTSLAFSLLHDKGERRMNIPVRATIQPTDVAVGYETSPWLLAKSVLWSMGYMLYYDGRGYAVARPLPQTPVLSFTEDAIIGADPQVGFDTSTLVNAVQVISTPPKGALGINIHRVKIAPVTHPLSPARLGINGVPGYYPKIIRDSNIKTIADADKRALNELNSGLLTSTEVSFDSLPHPYLEEWDVCYLTTSKYTAPFRLVKMSIPLVADGVSAIGYNRRVTPSLKAIRQRRR